MLVGSQLKNAQVEVVIDLDAANALDDKVVGRIVYVRELGQLFIYDDGTPSDSVAGWKPINTAEDSLAILATQSALITGGVGAAAPTNTLAAIDTDIAEIIDGTQAIVPVTNITSGTTSVISNKTPPQEMCFTWNLNGDIEKSTNYYNFDGFRTFPFDCEITGLSVSCNGELDLGGTGYLEIDLYSRPTVATDLSHESLWSTKCKLDGIAGSLHPAMYVSYLNEATGVMEVTNAEGNAGVGVNSDRHNVDCVYPVWTQVLTPKVDLMPKGCRIVPTCDATNMTNGIANDLEVTIFFRRLNFT